jgi:RNA polymerase sigma-70 factor (ECF subfamily)
MTTVTTDRNCVEQVLAGDLEGYGVLHRRYFEPTVRLVTGILNGDRAAAEDTVQEAFLSALEALTRLSDGDRFFPWLKRIAVNRAIEVRRHRQRKERLHHSWMGQVSSAGGGGDRPVLDRLAARERAGAVREALDRLPDGQRAAVVLRYFDGLSLRQVAEVLGCEEVTARTQVFRGLRKLGAWLDNELLEGV